MASQNKDIDWSISRFIDKFTNIAQYRGKVFAFQIVNLGSIPGVTYGLSNTLDMPQRTNNKAKNNVYIG